MHDTEKDEITENEILIEKKLETFQGKGKVLDLLLQHSEGRFD
jgi:hypothetical protein